MRRSSDLSPEVIDVLESHDPEEIEKALAQVETLRSEFESEAVRDLDEAVEDLDTLLGREPGGKAQPEVETITTALASVERPPRQGRKRPEPVVLPEPVKQVVLTALTGVEDRLRFHLDQARAWARAVRLATADTHAIPESDDLKELARYEAHLEDCITRTTKALRREQARRRLRDALPRLGQPGTGPWRP